MPQGVLQLLG